MWGLKNSGIGIRNQGSSYRNGLSLHTRLYYYGMISFSDLVKKNGYIVFSNDTYSASVPIFLALPIFCGTSLFCRYTSISLALSRPVGTVPSRCHCNLPGIVPFPRHCTFCIPICGFHLYHLLCASDGVGRKESS